MSREWKPGDVAVIRVGQWIGRALYNEWNGAGTWMLAGWCGEKATVVPADVSHVRPLVVVDPEDREQVERLSERVRDAEKSHGQDFWEYDQMALTHALREFANPTPPKPAEPTGLGAVVEDSDGHEWTRWSRGKWPARAPWRSDTAKPDHRHYDGINAVRVLSEGVPA